MSGVWPFIRRKQEVDRRNVDVFQPFRSLLIRKQTLLRRSMFRKLDLMKALLILNDSVTFATAAVRSQIATANNSYTAAAAFPRSHIVAVTNATVAARRILILWR